jgi:hypoxanthine phosphoribosyltransferase
MDSEPKGTNAPKRELSFINATREKIAGQGIVDGENIRPIGHGEFSTESRQLAHQQTTEFLDTLLGGIRHTVRSSREYRADFPDESYYSLLDMFRATHIPQSLSELNNEHAQELLPLREMRRVISPRSGGFVMNFKDEIPEEFQLFYSHNRFVRTTEGSMELRGVEYAVPISNRYKTADEKLGVIKDVLHDAIDVIGLMKRESLQTPQEYMLYMGVLDYMKMHANILYHTLTYNERNAQFPEDEEKEIYLSKKEKAEQLIKTTTRMFYQGLLGFPFDRDAQNLDDFDERIDSIAAYISDNTQMLSKEEAGHRFKYPEAHQPLIIAAGAFEAARAYKNTDIIIGIPTGGTECAIVTQLMFEKLHNSVPDICFVPLSYHSEVWHQDGEKGIGGLADADVVDLLNFNYPGLMLNKHVLLVDDNSSSGQTSNGMTRAVRKRHVASVDTHLTELDIRAFIDDRREREEGSYFLQERSPTTRGIMHLAKDGQPAHKKYFKGLPRKPK